MIPAAITILILIGALVVFAVYLVKQNQELWASIGDLAEEVQKLKQRTGS